MNTLWTTTPGTAYQWYWNGQMMQGETNDTLVPPVDLGGDYSVSVFSPSGCETSSFITLQGSIHVLPQDFQLTYQPENEVIHLSVNAPYTGEIRVQDLHGRTIILTVTATKSIDIPCQNLAKGVYFIRLGSLHAKRIVRY